jgi:hypothetical protein
VMMIMSAPCFRWYWLDVSIGNAEITRKRYR